MGSAPREQIKPEPLERAEDGEDIATTIHLPDLQTTQQFVDLLRIAVLEDSGMSIEDIENLRNPGQEPALVDPSPLLRSIRHFINNTGSSREHYDILREIELLNDPKNDFLSFDKVKRRVRWLSGVVPIENDMCVTDAYIFLIFPYF
jgi:hypothetical protein